MASGRRRNQAGSIRKLPSGRWQARRTEHDGRVRGLGTYRTKTDAEQALVLAEADELNGERHLGNEGTVGEWAEQWLVGARHLKARTLRNTEQVLRVRVIPHLGEVKVSELTRSQVEDWLSSLAATGYSPDSVRLAVAALRGVLRTAEAAGVRTQHPADRLGLTPRHKREMLVLTPAEVERLAETLAAHSSQDGLVVRLAAYAGLRAGEIAALRVGRIDITGQRIIVAESVADVNGQLVYGTTKSGRVRSVPLPKVLLSPLAVHLATRPEDPKALVFVGLRGGAWRHEHFYAGRFRPAACQIGYPDMRFHDLRHCYASWLIKAGCHPHTVMTLLGHSSITVTMGTYGHLMPGVDQEAADRLDAMARADIDDQSGTNLARASRAERPRAAIYSL